MAQETGEMTAQSSKFQEALKGVLAKIPEDQLKAFHATKVTI